VSRALAKCQVLYLNGNQIGDAGVKSLADACAIGALPQCRELLLSGNQIGDAGIIALAQAIKPVSEGGSGAMASLQMIYVHNAEHPRLKAACEARGIMRI
jgi:hypothetical protein